ncbi:MAG: 2'-5' RNA ligase family protein [Usitatibacteraceae bacterium]
MPKKRNVRKLRLRPPLPRRAIVWFPPLAADDEIETFRALHDPLALRIRAHVTLVFPFPTNLTSTQLASHVKRIIGNWPHLPVSFRDIDSIQDEFTILMVRNKAEAVIALHDKLYSGVLKPQLRAEMEYRPHITLGRVTGNPCGASHAEMQEAATKRLRGERSAIMKELAIVTLHQDGTISVDHSIPLNFA